jgi:hypothetical protein
VNREREEEEDEGGGHAVGYRKNLRTAVYQNVDRV